MQAGVKPAPTHELRRPRQRVGGSGHGMVKTLGRKVARDGAVLDLEGSMGRKLAHGGSRGGRGSSANVGTPAYDAKLGNC
jgi:hypothetical protein